MKTVIVLLGSGVYIMLEFNNSRFLSSLFLNTGVSDRHYMCMYVFLILLLRYNSNRFSFALVLFFDLNIFGGGVDVALAKTKNDFCFCLFSILN